jgi:hypothetical protein
MLQPAAARNLKDVKKTGWHWKANSNNSSSSSNPISGPGNNGAGNNGAGNGDGNNDGSAGSNKKKFKVLSPEAKTKICQRLLAARKKF